MEKSEYSGNKARDELSKRYANLLGAYQDDHSRLMNMLRDDRVSVEAFEEVSERLNQRLNELKAMKVELLRQRNIIRDMQDEGG